MSDLTEEDYKSRGNLDTLAEFLRGGKWNQGVVVAALRNTMQQVEELKERLDELERGHE